MGCVHESMHGWSTWPKSGQVRIYVVQVGAKSVLWWSVMGACHSGNLRQWEGPSVLYTEV